MSEIHTGVTPPEFDNNNQVDEAVADAMLYGQATLLKQYRKLINEGEYLPPSELLEEATEGACMTSTALSLSYLHHKHKDLFDSLTLLRSRGGEFTNTWLNHQVFLARSVDGTYYSGSPANYEKSIEPGNENERRKVNRLTQVHKSKDLHNLLAEIQQQDGGIWPSTDFVTHMLGQGKHKMPVDVYGNTYATIISARKNKAGDLIEETDSQVLPPYEG